VTSGGGLDPDEAAAGDGSAGEVEPTDDQLVVLAKAGDREAFGVLTTRHLDRVYQFVQFSLKMPGSAAEDLTQEVFLLAFRGLRTFSGRSLFRTWLYGIAKNVCRRHYATFQRDLRLCETDVALLVPDAQPSVVSVLEAQQARASLRSAIEALSSAQRAVVFMRDVDGLSYGEIAKALEIPVGTVRSRLHNARTALAASLRGTR
jgi:RNA polymerase sigma-70 factor (ECF subfamily)